VTVSDDELVELLQTLETMIVLGDVERASIGVQDWMKAHPGEARVVHDMGESRELFSEMTRDMSNWMRFALNYAYVNASRGDFSRSRTQAYPLLSRLVEFTVQSGHRGWTMALRRECISSLSCDSRVVDLEYSIFLLVDRNRFTRDGDDVRWEDVGRQSAGEIQAIIVWTREQYLARQALVRALQGDFETAICSLSLLKERLEKMNPEDLYIYTGLPYVPGPGDEL
jgi:hypothetical protein